MKFAIPLSLLVLPISIGCAPAPEVPEPLDLDVERGAIMTADQDWSDAYSNSDSRPDAFIDALVDNARLLPPDGPLAQGKEAIRTVIADLEAMPGFSVDWTPSAAEVGSAGYLGFTIGSYEMRMDGPEGGPIRIEGKYMTVWEKQSDGSWKVVADMFNADGPPTPVEE